MYLANIIIIVFYIYERHNLVTHIKAFKNYFLLFNIRFYIQNNSNCLLKQNNAYSTEEIIYFF